MSVEHPRDSHNAIFAAARGYLSRGWQPVPVKPKSKNPGFQKWEQFRLDDYSEENWEDFFPAESNIGLLLGLPSGGLADVDCDCPEAIFLARVLLPRTGLIGGRPSAPNSHYWFIVDDEPSFHSQKFVGPKGTIVEMRGTGGQTVVWPSIHPEGEQYAWTKQEQGPAHIQKSELLRCITKIAIASLLAQSWPDLGARHDAALPVAGLFLSYGWPEQEAADLILLACQAAGHSKPEDRRAAVQSTYRKQANGAPVTGIPSLKKFFPELVIRSLVDWCKAIGTPRNGNEHAHRSDEEENRDAQVINQERDDPHDIITDFSCPDVLWQGLFEKIAERLENRSWEVWLGTLCAMGATAHKNLHWLYHRALFGMVYGLLISPTGQGKGLCADVCDALLPEDYMKRDSVQSGPALFPILAHIEKDPKGKILAISPRPAILIIEEWTTLLKSSKIEFSNLQETLNNLFHRKRPWNVSRSDTEKSGGDRDVKNPTLSICAMSTDSLLREQVTDSMIRSGFLNRYLVIPGSSPDNWDFYDENMAGVDVDLVKGYLDHLVSYAWGEGRNVWTAYAPDAKERIVTWGRMTFNPIMRDRSLEAQSIKRLHVYSHIIALLYAWSDQRRYVELQHVEAAIAAVTLSRLFIESLLMNTEVEAPKYKQYEASLEQKIILRLTRTPDMTQRQLIWALRSKAATSSDISRTVGHLMSAGLITNEDKKKKTLRVSVSPTNGKVL